MELLAKRTWRAKSKLDTDSNKFTLFFYILCFIKKINSKNKNLLNIQTVVCCDKFSKITRSTKDNLITGI